MIIVIDADNRAAHRATLRTMFEARKSVFIDLLKWDLPALSGRFEIDRFDDRHAVYVVLVDARGTHLASARLLRSDRPGILNTLFSDLCAGPVPEGPAIHEITRFCLSRTLRAPARRIVRDRLVVALVSLAHERGIRCYTGVADLAWAQQILAFGWACAPLGLPRPHAGATLAAFRIDIAADTHARLAAAGIVDDSAPALSRAA